MWKLRIGVLVISGALGLGLSSAAWAGSGGDSNRGDVWLDNVEQSAGPGHEMDPHLACANIALWASDLGEASGSFTIDGWSPTGSHGADYSANWSYPQNATGPQVVAVIDYSKLISQAEKNGDAAAAQGFHFKLDFSQDPQKHKTFWLDCPPSSSGGGGGGPTPGGGGTPPGGGGTPPSGGTPGTGSVVTPVLTASPVKTSVGGVTARRKRPARKRHHKLVRPARHQKAHRRKVKAVTVGAPPFTG